MQSHFLQFTLFTLLIIAAAQIEAASSVSSSSYVAAVVEFHESWTGASVDELLSARIDQYVKFIKDASDQHADIIVFPESTLTQVEQPQFVPDPIVRTTPCDNNTFESNGILARISCAARRGKVYTVINLTMMRPCDEHVNGVRCVSEWSLYNTNVVFDRNGTVISIYRKVNPYNERAIQTTAEPDISIFKTDFGVEFGQFICFDMLFPTPSVEILRRGVRNFIKPSMWFNQLPFLSGVQSQQGWAFAYDVNLLAAGSNNASVGSSGTGIFSGRAGAVRRVVTAEPRSQLLIGEIEKVPPRVLLKEQIALDLPAYVQGIQLKRDRTPYLYVPLKTAEREGSESDNRTIVVPDGGHECRFQYAVKTEAPAIGQVSYTYQMVAYKGLQSRKRAVYICAVVACTEANDSSTCGTIFDTNQTVQHRHTFTHLEISGTYSSTLNHVNLTMPSTLSTQLLPLQSDEFNYTESIDERFTNVSIQLRPRNDHHLLTFGVYSIDRSVGVVIQVSMLIHAAALVLLVYTHHS